MCTNVMTHVMSHPFALLFFGPECVRLGGLSDLLITRSEQNFFLFCQYYFVLTPIFIKYSQWLFSTNNKSKLNFTLENDL